MAAVGGVILDGRDIGSVVLPNAELKIYLTASVDARAKRRWLEVQGTSNEQTLDEIKKNVVSRDAIPQLAIYFCNRSMLSFCFRNFLM